LAEAIILAEELARKSEPGVYARRPEGE
jgi:hypothetical protein